MSKTDQEMWEDYMKSYYENQSMKVDAIEKRFLNKRLEDSPIPDPKLSIAAAFKGIENDLQRTKEESERHLHMVRAHNRGENFLVAKLKYMGGETE